MLPHWLTALALSLSPGTLPPPVVALPAQQPVTSIQEPEAALERSPDADRIPCGHCTGSGLVEQACSVCAGEKQHACRNCAPPATGFAATFQKVDAWVPEALTKALGDMLKDVASSLEGLDTGAIGLPKGAPSAARPKAGELLCPAKCRGGKLAHLEDWVDCKLCKGGKFKCGACKKGQVACRHCKRKGRLQDRCGHCDGAGQLPNPLELNPQLCPWCLGKTKRDCQSCLAGSKNKPPCRSCSGEGKLTCRTCRGLGKLACQQCGGRGRFGPQRTRCTDCKKKGGVVCGSCTKGEAECGQCQAGDAPASCMDCKDTRKVTCGGCHAGAYLAWEASAEWFAEGNDLELAKRWLAEAQRRQLARYNTFIAALREAGMIDEALIGVCEEERDEEAARLRGMAKALER